MPRQPGAGVASVEGEGVPEAAADWTVSGEQEGGGAAAAKAEGWFPADAKKNLRLFGTNQLQPPQSVFPSPCRPIPPVVSRF